MTPLPEFSSLKYLQFSAEKPKWNPAREKDPLSTQKM